ncbi:Ig-like domain-containing protein [Methanobrevibacter sp.]|uniref:Ig-like domain-containing protein n=1 Tax=Methanobrevibacter sp. TaxID=66852 RepID=UPI00388F0B3A
MKLKKIMIVSLLLLAILTIGAVSASEGADTLAVGDGADDLAVDESSAEVLADGDELSYEDIDIGVDCGHQYSASNEEMDNVINVMVPKESNGTVVISSGDKILINKDLKDFSDDRTWDDEWCDGYGINNADLNFFNGLSNEDLVKISFYSEGKNIATNYYMVFFEDGNFWLDNAIWVDYYVNEWSLMPLYVDSNDSVILININNPDVTGTFYVYCNNYTYRYEVRYDEWGGAGHDWILSSFDINSPGLYPFTVKYGDDEATSEIIKKGTLNVTEFNYDAFRLLSRESEQSLILYCPAGSEGAIISIFVKDDWEDEYSTQPTVTHEITKGDENTWLSWTYDEFNAQKEEDSIYYVIIKKGDEFIFNNDEDGQPQESSFWYDDDTEEQFTLQNATIEISRNDYSMAGDNEDDVVKLWIPEKMDFSKGTFKITSGKYTLFSKELSYKEMDFWGQARAYEFASLSIYDLNFKGLKNGDIITFSFTSDNGIEVNASCFYEKYKEDGETFVVFYFDQYYDANIVEDDVALLLSNVPAFVDDEFVIELDICGETIKTRWNISQLTKNEKGLYEFRCSDLGVDKVIKNVGIDNTINPLVDACIQFYSNGIPDDDYYSEFRVCQNPWLATDEMILDCDDLSIISFTSFPKNAEKTFYIHVSKDGAANKTYTFNMDKLSKYFRPAPEWDDEALDSYVFELPDLKIASKGKYDVTIEFRVNGAKKYYATSFEVVDYIIEKPTLENALDDINARVLTISLPIDATGKVIIYVNGTKVVDTTLSEIGVTYADLDGFHIPLNALQITESGVYDLQVDVIPDKGDSRTINTQINVTVSENSVEFKDMIYGINNLAFMNLNMGSPVPANSSVVIYFNGTKAVVMKVGTGFYDDLEFNKYFKDEINALKPGEYNVEVKLVSAGTETSLGSGTFNVLNRNGTVNVNVPTKTILSTDSLFAKITSLLIPTRGYEGKVQLKVYIDPYMDDIGEIDSENYDSFNYWDLEYFCDDADGKFSLGTLSGGTHTILVSYYVDFDEVDSTSFGFFSDKFTLNVKKTTTKITVKSLKTTYNSGKYLVATIKDSRGKAVKGVTVTFKTKGVTKKIKSDKNGQIKFLASDLKAGTYSATFTFAGDSVYEKSSASVKFTITKASTALTPKAPAYKASVKTKKYTVTVKASKKPLKKAVLILKVNGKTYKVKTNTKGVATFKVTNLARAGTYTATAQLTGTASYKAASKSFKIVVK